MSQNEQGMPERFGDEFSASNMPNDLALAANALVRLAATSPSGGWQQCGEPDDLEAQKQALSACRASLMCVERLWQEAVEKNLSDLREKAVEVEKFLMAPAPP
jgi:hypothetical protein